MAQTQRGAKDAHDMPDTSVTHMSEINSSFADSQLVQDVAQALVSATAGSVVPLADLPLVEQEHLKRIATMALRLQNRQLVDLATWIAASAVAVEHYGNEFERLPERDQRACRLMSTTAILAYEHFLKGHTDPYREKQTRALVERITEKFIKRNTAIVERACEHEFVTHMIPMPQGYEKPGATTCSKCGAYKPVEQVTATDPSFAVGMRVAQGQAAEARDRQALGLPLSRTEAAHLALVPSAEGSQR